MRDEPDMANNPNKSMASRERGAAAQRAQRGGSKTPSAKAILNHRARSREQFKQRRTINRRISHSNMHQRGKCELHPIYHNGQNMAVTNDNLPMFAWDHLDRTTKKDTIAKLIDVSTPNAIQTEIDKCQLVCHNCHAMKTKENKDYSVATYINPHQPTLF